MKNNRSNNQIRDIRNGDWFWVHKVILGHYARQLRASGVLVYNALALFANSRTQTCFPTQEALAETCGLSRRTVIRSLRMLEQLNLIKVKRKRGSCVYYLLEPNVTEKSQLGDASGTSDVTGSDTNDNYLTKINNNIVNEDKNFLNSKASKGFKPKTKEELIALDIARELNDLKSFPVYLFYAKKYPESLLKMLLGEVRELPLKKIKKSRAALFNHLIKKYDQRASKNHRD